MRSHVWFLQAGHIVVLSAAVSVVVTMAMTSQQCNAIIYHDSSSTNIVATLLFTLVIMVCMKYMQYPEIVKDVGYYILSVAK